jgi:hypothetical protein
MARLLAEYRMPRQLPQTTAQVRPVDPRVVERRTYCQFTVKAPLEQARAAFEQHVCTVRRKGGFRRSAIRPGCWLDGRLPVKKVGGRGRARPLSACGVAAPADHWSCFCGKAVRPRSSLRL